MSAACHSANVIRKVDLLCQRNNADHNTDEITTRQLIVRRGQPFLITVEMAFAFQPSDTLKFTVETGCFPSENKGTRSTFSNRGHKCTAGSKAVWSCRVDDRSDLQRGIVTLSVTPAVDAPVGRYALSVEPERGSAVKERLVVLFNPWCRDDMVFLPDEKERREYAMNEQGIIYTGTAHCIQPCVWEFGQFEEEMVDICLKLLDVNPKYQKDPVDDVAARCNPIYVSRVISAMINSNDDRGVLTGCWDDNYQGGTCPTRWNSSFTILQQWYENSCMTVKFGQCWVFAGVMHGDAVLRYTLPCRHKLESGHDENNSLTIDEYFDEYGLKSKEGSEGSGLDEAPDLNRGSKYDGWQALDPTPQERSEGVFCCGPAPVAAIHEGATDLKYDIPFVFSEVNADKVKWRIKADGSKTKMKHLSDTSTVGQNISTKAVGSFTRNDITDTYKYREGSAMDRVVYDNAVKWLNSRDDDSQRIPCEYISPEEVEMSLEEATNVRNAHNIKLNLKLRNKAQKYRRMTIFVNAQAMNYTGTVIQNILHEIHEKTLQAGEVVKILIHSVYSKYSANLDSVKVTAQALDGDGEIYEAETNLALEDPTISIKVLGEARVNCPMTIEVEFENPLNETLRFCSMTVTGCGLFRSGYIDSGIKELEPNSTLKLKITVTPYKVRLKTLVADFDCSAFRDVKGSCTVYVKP